MTAVTSMFMHASWAHLLGNMLFLWIFGNNVEDALGHARFLVFYLVGGFAATTLQSAVTLWSGTDADAAIPNLGASGAVSAVLGAYLLLLPGAKVLTLVVLHPPRDPGDRLPRRLVSLPALCGERFAPEPRAGRRRRVLRPRRRLRVRNPPRQARPDQAATPAAVLMAFEDEVRAALDSLPPELAAALVNIAVVVEDVHPDDPDLFGLYEGIPLTERGSGDFGQLPDRIAIYRRPLEEEFPDPAELREEIRITVLHELAHYFGFDENRIAELGYE